MERRTLYRYHSGTETIVSPIEPAEGIETEILFRLIADEGKLLKKGDIVTPCIDVEIIDVVGWEEIDDPDYEPPIDDSDDEPLTED